MVGMRKYEKAFDSEINTSNKNVNNYFYMQSKNKPLRTSRSRMSVGYFFFLMVEKADTALQVNGWRNYAKKLLLSE